MIPWILISVVILGALVLFIAVLVKKKGRGEVDYRNFFVMGIIWLAFGLIYPIAFGRAFELSGLVSMGIIFTVVGLANRDKWGKKVKPEPLTKNQKILLGALVLVTVLAVALTFLLGTGAA